MGWFKRIKGGITTSTHEKKETPDGLWTQCPRCKKIIPTEEHKKNLHVCSNCNYHSRIGSTEYFEILFDNNKFTELNQNIESLDPLKINDKSSLIEKLSIILNIDKDILNKKLSNKNNYYIKRNITPTEHQKIIDLGEINLRVHNEKKRIYTYQNIASHIVGYVSIDQEGLAGIERSFNDKLSNSEDIHLTIDINLQQSVREKLKETIDLYRAESGLAVIMDISNGHYP